MSSPKNAAKISAKISNKIGTKLRTTRTRPTGMGALKTASKAAAGTAAKAVRGKPVRIAGKSSLAGAGGVSAEAKRLAAALERCIVEDKLDLVAEDALQALFAAACRVYTARREAGAQFMPVARNSVSATDVMVTASGLLRAADLAVFELGMWQNWTGR